MIFSVELFIITIPNGMLSYSDSLNWCTVLMAYSMWNDSKNHWTKITFDLNLCKIQCSGMLWGELFKYRSEQSVW